MYTDLLFDGLLVLAGLILYPLIIGLAGIAVSLVYRMITLRDPMDEDGLAHELHEQQRRHREQL